MQPDSITLSVDAANDGNPANQVFTRYAEYDNRSEYIGADHSIALKDELKFYRTQPKPNGNFKGTARSTCKFSKDYAVPGVDETTTVASPVIVEVSFSCPVGVSSADITEMRQRAVSLLDDDTVMVALNELLMI